MCCVRVSLCVSLTGAVALHGTLGSEAELLNPAESGSGGQADSAERLRLLPLTVEQQLGLIQIY